MLPERLAYIGKWLKWDRQVRLSVPANLPIYSPNAKLGGECVNLNAVEKLVRGCVIVVE